MGFIREIYWCLDIERNHNEHVPFSSTPKGRVLMRKNSLGLLRILKQFSPPKDTFKQEREIKEDHLLDSVIFLRNKIVAHYDEEYPIFKGDKVSILIQLVSILFLVQLYSFRFEV
jgi:hypothetical protein